jgi:succinoglycan biosynthesis transport protein ExoP
VTLAFLIQALRRHLLIGLITLVAVTLGGIAVGSLWPKTYTSNAGILLGLELKAKSMDPQTANLYLKDRVATYAELMTSDEVITPVADKSKLTPEDLRRRVVVVIVPETVVLEVSVTGSTPQQAVELTRAVTENFSRQVSTYNVRTGGPAILPAQIFSPRPATEPDQLHGVMLVAVAGVVGLVLGILLPLLMSLAAASRSNSRLRLAAARRAGEGDPEAKQDTNVQPSGADVENEKKRRRRGAPQQVNWDWNSQ